MSPRCLRCQKTQGCPPLWWVDIHKKAAAKLAKNRDRWCELCADICFMLERQCKFPKWLICCNLYLHACIIQIHQRICIMYACKSKLQQSKHFGNSRSLSPCTHQFMLAATCNASDLFIISGTLTNKQARNLDSLPLPKESMHSETHIS